MFIVRGLGGRARRGGCERKWGFRKWGRGCEGVRMCQGQL